MLKKIKKCRSCSKRNLVTLFDMGQFYLQGSFYKKNYSNPSKKKFSLKLLLCKNCSLVQLAETISKKHLYKDYWYLSGINKTMKNHLKKLVMKNTEISGVKNKLKVLDIGCNDGTLLNFYPSSFNKFGIDPSNAISKIKIKNCKIIKDYFPSNKINKLDLKFDIITSIAMYYDVDNPVLFAKKVKNLLSKNGFWVIELSYLLKMLELNSFDTICHEHLEYYSLTSLKFIMKKAGLKIFRIEFNNINGGSIRCYIAHLNNNFYDSHLNLEFINKILKKEKLKKIKSKKIFLSFFNKIKLLKSQIRMKLLSILRQNKIIHGYGASTKGNTILQWLDLDNKYLKFIADRNRLKWGARTVGTNIDIISEKKSLSMKPDYYLVLPWHFREEIQKRESKFLRRGGALIYPLPKLKIIKNK